MICNPYSDCEAVFESPVPPITVNDFGLLWEVRRWISTHGSTKGTATDTKRRPLVQKDSDRRQVLSLLCIYIWPF